MINEKALEAQKISHGLANTELVWLENLAGIGCPELHQYICQQKSNLPFDEAIKIAEVHRMKMVQANIIDGKAFPEALDFANDLITALKARLPK